MNGYPKARWSPGEGSLMASVWTRNLAEGEGGGYYLYTWQRGTSQISLEELAEGTTRSERRAGLRSRYVTLAVLEVPDSVSGLERADQEIAVARIIHADLRERFGEMAEWIDYGGDGKPVWFHESVTGQG